MSEIDITKYFVIHKDKRGKIFAIEQINPKELFEEITKQNEQLHHYKQAIKEIKDIAEQNMDDKQIVAVQTMLNGSPDPKNEVLAKIIQKCEEVNNAR